MSEQTNSKGIMDREIPKFEPRLPEFLLDKMNPMEREMFSRLDVNSQQTEHTLRVVLEGREERHKLVASVASIQQAHAEHCAQDKRDFGDLRDKYELLNQNVGRCAATLDSWSGKLTTVCRVFSYLFGRKGLLTGVLVAVLTWFAVEWFKVHSTKPAPEPPRAAQK